MIYTASFHKMLEEKRWVALKDTRENISYVEKIKFAVWLYLILQRYQKEIDKNITAESAAELIINQELQSIWPQ